MKRAFCCSCFSLNLSLNEDPEEPPLETLMTDLRSDARVASELVVEEPQSGSFDPSLLIRVMKQNTGKQGHAVSQRLLLHLEHQYPSQALCDLAEKRTFTYLLNLELRKKPTSSVIISLMAPPLI